MSAFCVPGPSPELVQLADQDISVSVTTSALRSFGLLSCGNVSMVQLTGMSAYLECFPLRSQRAELPGVQEPGRRDRKGMAALAVLPVGG